MTNLMKTHKLFNKHVWNKIGETNKIVVFHCHCGLYRILTLPLIKDVIKYAKRAKLIPENVSKKNIILNDWQGWALYMKENNL